MPGEFPRCAEKGVGFVIGAVFASGILATGAVQGARYAYSPATVGMLGKVARIEAVCGRHGVPIAAAALQFPLGHPLVASVIPGGLSPERSAGAVEGENGSDLIPGDEPVLARFGHRRPFGGCRS